MNSKEICPECNGNKVVDIYKSMGDKAMLHKFICLDCGYAREFASSKYLESLRKNAEKGKL